MDEETIPVPGSIEHSQTSFLEESPGQRSSMRLMSLGALILSGVYGVLAIMQNSDIGLMLSVSALLGAFGPKGAQKFVEMKYGTKD